MGIVKVANYNGKLEDFNDLMFRYSDDVIRIPVGRPDVSKYAFIFQRDEGKVMLTTSYGFVKNIKHPNVDYNVIAHIVSKSESLEKQILEEFIESTALQLRDAPDHLVKGMKLVEAVFLSTV